MKVYGINVTRLVLGSILVIFSKAISLNASSISLSDESFKNTPDLTRQRSVPVLRIRGRTPRMPHGQDYQPEFNRFPDVSVTCSSEGFVLRVKKSFYGFSTVAEELVLGETCRSNGVLEPHEDLLFTYALTDCQGKQQELPDYVVYKYVLHYVPLSHRNPAIYHRVDVGVECRYKRNHHVHSLMMRPTVRTPLRKVIRSRSGDFQIQLMDDSWFSPVRSAVYLLGQNVNVQVSTRHHYPGVKLFINSCYVATVNTLSKASKYSIIDNYGCLQESRINPGVSRFRFSRADNVVQFSFGAFQFIDAPDAQLSLHCEVSVSGEGPSPIQKSCFYRHPDKRWISVFGQDSVCDCCDSFCNQTVTEHIIYDGVVSSDQALFSDTSMASSTLNYTLMAHDDINWFEAKLAEEPQRSYTHEDFVAHIKRPQSRTSPEELLKEERKEMEEEKHGDVEVLMALSESFVGSERPDLDSTEEFEVESLGWSEKRKMEDMNKGISYLPKTVQTMGSSMNTSVIVNETMEQHSKINESTLGDGKPFEVFLPPFISEEKEKINVNEKEGLDFQLIDMSMNDEAFPAGSDELVEQGVVRKLDLTQDSDDYY